MSYACPRISLSYAWAGFMENEFKWSILEMFKFFTKQQNFRPVQIEHNWRQHSIQLTSQDCMAIVNFLEHESFLFSTPEYKTSEKVEKAKEGAVWGMLIGDAIGMPAHWFYKPSDIKTYYDGWLTGYEAPGKHPSSIICITPDGMYKLQPITTQYHILTHQRYIAVENIVREGEIACNKQFLLFSQCFLPFMALIFHSKCTLNCLQIVSI